MITSLQNKIVKQVISLQNKKNREKLGLFVIENEKFICEISKKSIIKYLIFSEAYFLKNKIPFSIKNVEYYIVSNNIFNKISETINPQGVLAVCYIKDYKFDYSSIKGDEFFVMLDCVMEPGNLGTIIRTADAFGADAVFLLKGCVDLYNSKVLRSTAGSIFNIPIIQNCDVKITLNNLKQKNIKIISTYLNASKQPSKINFKQGCCIVIGNEANGVSLDAVEMSDYLVKIPILGKAESLNASIAAAIIFYEVTSQRINL